MKPKQTLYKGAIIPMVTPINEDLTVDVESTARILDTFMEASVSPFVLGTTGESLSLSTGQKTLLVQTTINHINHRVSVYAGISGNCLAESIEQANQFAGYGVDAVVAHLPFYYPLSDNQIIRYFLQLADNIKCPLIIYNMPGTTHLSIPIEIIDQLSFHPNIAGVKDSEKGLERLEQSVKLWNKRPDFVYLMGCAVQSAIALHKGADGIVPSLGNFVPQLYGKLYNAILNDDNGTAELLQSQSNEIATIYQKDKTLSQSIPALKTMMSAIGLCKPYAMPPMITLSDEEQKIIRNQALEVHEKFSSLFPQPVKQGASN
ncbi:MAG: dihydrodipicolinate synthase family protein [Bacteroidota bacterium]|nr:dihydrodipicolinate synthase family protein [Bacteroidota bacterium]